MDLEARKSEFIQEFLKIQSEEAISRLEKVLKKEKKLSGTKFHHSMSKKELNNRIDQSMKDSKEGRVIDQEDLIVEVEKWN